MGNNQCKRLGINPDSEITSSMLLEIWNKFDHSNSGMLKKKQAMRFLKDFATALGIPYSDELGEEYYSYCDVSNSGLLTFRQFECLVVEAAQQGNAMLSESLRVGDVTALSRVLDVKNKGKKVLDLSRIPVEEFPGEMFELSDVRTLKLMRMGLSKLPKALKRLGNVRSIRASHNLFTEIPEVLVDMPALQELELNFNRVHELTHRLTNVRQLRIEVNAIESISRGVRSLPKLEEISLAHNKISALPAPLLTVAWLHITSINLKDNQLPALPQEIGRLSCLTDIDLRRNCLSSIPDTFSCLTQLKRLSLGGNAIRTLPQELSRLCELEWFECEDNALTTLPLDFCAKHMHMASNRLQAVSHPLWRAHTLSCPHNNLTDGSILFTGLTSLQHLNLGYNALTTLPDQLSSAAKLTYLDVQHNDLTGIPSTIRRLRGLVYLNATCNRITRLPSSIWNLRNLNHVQFAENVLTELPPASADDVKCRGLETLTLGHNALGGDAMGVVVNLKSLRTLDMGYNRLESVDKRISQLSSLTLLHLSGNKIAKLPASIGGCTQLRDLYLANNVLKSISGKLAALPKLTTLDVSHNEIESVERITQIPALTWLDCSHNPLRSVPESLLKMPQLDELYLEGLSEVVSEKFEHSIPRFAHGIRERGQRFSISTADMRGTRSTMEDCTAFRAATTPSGSLVDVYCVMDGHSGRSVAEHACTALVNIVIEMVLESTDDVNFRGLLQRAFRKVSSSVRRAGIGRDEGATAVVALFVGKKLYVANAGDSRAVLSRRRRAIRLSHDHKPTDSAEGERIRAQGGFVDDNGRVNGIVGVSRSFGDYSLEPFVTFEPFISVTEVNASDEFVILACDGVWDVFSDQEAVNLVQSVNPVIAATVLRDHAFMRGSDDNISTLVITINKMDLSVSRDSLLTSSSSEASLQTMLNSLGLSVFREILRTTTTNIVVSPATCVLPLVLLLGGTSESVRQELHTFLIGGEDEATYSIPFLLSEMAVWSDGNIRELQTTYDLWVCEAEKRDAYFESLPTSLRHRLQLRANGRDRAAAISRHAQDSTRGLVNIEVSNALPDSCVVATSVAALSRMLEFHREGDTVTSTRKGVFLATHKKDVSPVRECDFVAISRSWKSYVSKRYQAVVSFLGDDDRLSALFIAPVIHARRNITLGEQFADSWAALESLVDSLDESWITHIQFKTNVRKLTVMLPRINTLASVCDLRAPLQNMGLCLPFNDVTADGECDAAASTADNGPQCNYMHGCSVELFPSDPTASYDVTEGSFSSPASPLSALTSGSNISFPDLNEVAIASQQATLERLEESETRLEMQRRSLVGETVMSFDRPYLMVIFDNVLGQIMFAARVCDPCE